MKSKEEQEAGESLRALLRELNAAENPDGLQLAALKRSKGEVRILWQEFRGQPLLHLRLWALTDTGQLVPTRRGVAFQISELPAVAEAIAAAADLAADSIRDRKQGG